MNSPSCSVTKDRFEVIVKGTRSSDPRAAAAEWLEYEFKCKPGNVTRRPCLVTPYHYRLDWLMWFAGFQVAFLFMVFPDFMSHFYQRVLIK